MERIRSAVNFITQSYKRVAALLVIVGLLLAIPITLGSLSRTQDIRQRASTTSTALAIDIKSPTVASQDTSIGSYSWLVAPGSFVSNVLVPDSIVAYHGGVPTGGITNYIKTTGYGFNIPQTATIQGVTVEILGGLNRTSDNAGKDASVRLVNNGVISGQDRTRGALWGGNYVSYGGETDLWGLNLTPGDINSANFGVVVAATIGLSTPAIDHIRINVAYTLQTETPTPTSVLISNTPTPAITFVPTVSQAPTNTPIPTIPQDTASLSLKPFTQSVSVGQSLTLTLEVDSQTTNINALATKINYPQNLIRRTRLTYSQTYERQVQEVLTDGSITILRGTTTPTNGTKTIATITFEALSTGVANITLSNSQVISSTQNVNIFSQANNASITISSQGTSPTVASCVLKDKGDANCDGKVTIIDFNIWRDEFKQVLGTTTSDFNAAGGVTIVDFNIWRDGFRDPNVAH